MQFEKTNTPCTCFNVLHCAIVNAFLLKQYSSAYYFKDTTT